MTLIQELIDLREQVHRGDFVLRLTEGVTNPGATRQNGRQLGFMEFATPGSFDATVGSVFYATKDGRFMKFEAPYPRLSDALYKVLKCLPTIQAVQAAVMQWNAEELERALRDEGGAVCVVRSPEEWLAHPVGAWPESPSWRSRRSARATRSRSRAGCRPAAVPSRAFACLTTPTWSAAPSRRAPSPSSVPMSCTSAALTTPTT